MPKITKKMMNKIHNEMVRRFSPYWDRKNSEIISLRDDLVLLRKQHEEFGNWVKDQLTDKYEAETEVKHVATTTRDSGLKGELWKAIFLHEGKDVSLTVTKEVCAELSALYIAFVTTENSASGTSNIRLTPSYYNHRDDLLAARVSQLMGISVKVHWVKLP